MKSLLFATFFLILSFVTSAQTPTTAKYQCSGITAKGKQCTRKISSGTFCYQHINSNDNSKKGIATAAAGANGQAKTQCIGITAKGTRCSRNAAAGSTACFQHQSQIK